MLLTQRMVYFGTTVDFPVGFVRQQVKTLSPIPLHFHICLPHLFLSPKPPPLPFTSLWFVISLFSLMYTDTHTQQKISTYTATLKLIRGHQRQFVSFNFRPVSTVLWSPRIQLGGQCMRVAWWLTEPSSHNKSLTSIKLEKKPRKYWSVHKGKSRC